MKKSGEYFVPDIMGGPARYLNSWAEIEPTLIRTLHRRSVVQAGGHVGIFPAKLAETFKRVYTFEPEYENFECLVRNAGGRNIFPMRALVGDVRVPRALRINRTSTGGHSVGAAGDIPMLRIDDLGLQDCDAIMLDLEGYEFFALIGAMETIGRCRPLLIVEQNKKARSQGFEPGAIQALLRAQNYRHTATAGENLVFEAA